MQLVPMSRSIQRRVRSGPHQPLGFGRKVLACTIVVLGLPIGLGVVGGFATLLGQLHNTHRTAAAVVWRYALPGVAFRPVHQLRSGRAWGVAYVLVSKAETWVLDISCFGPNPDGSGFPISCDGPGNQAQVHLTDVHGHAFARVDTSAPLHGYEPEPAKAIQIYATAAFEPLPAGTTIVQVHHDGLDGEVVQVPIDMHAVARASAPIFPRTVRKVHGVSVALKRVVSGALYSELDLSIRGFKDFGVASTSNSGTITTRFPSYPGVLKVTARGGRDLSGVEGGQAENGTLELQVAFKAPKRGAPVSVLVDDIAAPFGPENSTRVHGPWTFTFSIP